jgi:hypothetical protein
MGIAAGCDLFHSNGSNPDSMNEVYTFLYNVPVFFPPNDSMSFCENGCYGHDWYIDYINVNYPTFFVCHAQTGTEGEFIDPLTKEKVKVTHKEGNYYKLRKINGNITSKNIKYKIKKDKASDLLFNKIKDGKEHYGAVFNYANKHPHEKYLKYIKHASDTTGIFPTWQHFAVKPNQ